MTICFILDSVAHSIMSQKRELVFSTEESMEDARDTVMKRFKDRCPIIDLVMDRKLISMTKEEKEMWAKETSCSSLLFGTKLFVCKHLLGSV